MKYLILSDIHFRKKFEEKKMNFLINLIKKYENIIINGDLYEAVYIKPKAILNGGYKPLWELLKQKNTLYIYGNHDPQHKSEEMAKYISKKQYDYLKIKLGETYYHIEHGHKLGFKLDKLPNFIYIPLDYISYEIQHYFDFLTRHLGTKWNKIILNHRSISKIIKKNEILIVGHTHVKTLDLNNKFINGGYIKYGRGSYIVISNKNSSLKSVKY